MIRFLFAALLALSMRPTMAADLPAATLYKDPQCGCCEAYADHLQAEGFMVAVQDTEDLSATKERHGVPAGYEGCHTVLIDGYVVEGHVPVGVIERLLAERPDVRGISLPGMPLGSPGMSGTKSEPFTIHAFGKGEPTVYAVE
ncbi:MAG: metal-binding protein [Rhodospirillaceae bacterium]|nr:metal-binding protein [Rhodospirillaceae bacterium]|tara:strand:- start:161 stop:589 length:429 start_codon:yes stop_codon:yes gene_type:complete